MRQQSSRTKHSERNQYTEIRQQQRRHATHGEENMTTRNEEETTAALSELKPLPKQTRRGESEVTEATLRFSSEFERDEETELTQQIQLHNTSGEEAITEEEQNRQQQRYRNRRIRVLIGLCLAALIIFVIIDSTTTRYIKSAIDSLLKWVEENPVAGILAFTLFVFVATVAFVPGAIVTLGAGYVFERAWGNLGLGVLVGSITVFVGASVGAIVSFLIGRYLLRDCVDRLAHRYSMFEALDAVMKTKGFRIMALLRLSPIIPFNAINYISGITSISLLSYSLANIAVIPGTVLFVFVGASTGCIANNMGSGATVTIVSFIIGAVFAVFAIFLTSFYARRELNKIIASRESEQEQDDVDLEEGVRGGDNVEEAQDDVSRHSLQC